MPSPSDDLRTANAELVRRVRRDLAAFWASLNLGRPEASRDALLAYLPVLTTLYGQAAATVAADWYDETRAGRGVAGRFLATPATPFAAEYVRERTKFGAQHLFTATPDQTLKFLLGAAQKYSLQPGRDTITQATMADPQASGWHRETRSEACDFCRMLAGRGGVYRRQTATFAAHGDCHCTAMPSWDANAKEVPVSAYVASQTTAGMSPNQKAKHRARVRAYLANH